MPVNIFSGSRNVRPTLSQGVYNQLFDQGRLRRAETLNLESEARARDLAFGEQQKEFGLEHGLKERSFAEGQREFNVGQGLKEKEFTEGTRQFNVSDQRKQQELAQALQIHKEDNDAYIAATLLHTFSQFGVGDRNIAAETLRQMGHPEFAASLDRVASKEAEQSSEQLVPQIRSGATKLEDIKDQNVLGALKSRHPELFGGAQSATPVPGTGGAKPPSNLTFGDEVSQDIPPSALAGQSRAQEAIKRRQTEAQQRATRPGGDPTLKKKVEIPSPFGRF